MTQWEDSQCQKIISLTKLCVLDNEFTFEGTWYAQVFGLAMGNCLSPILANSFMEFFEKYLLSKIKPENIPWYRYLDDVIALVPIDFDTNLFLAQLNELVPSINFTIEEEINGRLGFLDVMIQREDRVFKFDIFRKETNVNSFIHAYSAHTWDTKRAVFTQMYHRAFKICSPEYIDLELDRIMDIGLDLGYAPSFLKKSLCKVRENTVAQTTVSGF